MLRPILAAAGALALGGAALAQDLVDWIPAHQGDLRPSATGDGVKTLTAPGTGPAALWSLGTRAGDFIHVVGMHGIDPQVEIASNGDEACIRQAYANIKGIVEAEGATLKHAMRITVFVTDLVHSRPIVNMVEMELWGDGPYPPRTIVEVARLNQNSRCEVEGTFYAPAAARLNAAHMAYGPAAQGRARPIPRPARGKPGAAPASGRSLVAVKPQPLPPPLRLDGPEMRKSEVR
jgi:2-iminobutanoate/2-iminopropanoate deaminase